MKKILLIKTSSIGDVIHNLPVVTDVKTQFPDAEIDWVVEETFASIPSMHAGVRTVIPVAFRRWRRTIVAASTWSEMRAFRQRLRQQEYDAILDTQGLIKSALLTRQARGLRYGYDQMSAREPLAAMFYNKTFSVPWGIHAIERNRQLVAQALNYAPGPNVDFGISASSTELPWLPAQNYAVLLHGSSAISKLWPQHNWIRLGAYLATKGIISILPWGNQEEHARSVLLSRQISGAISPKQLGLDDMAGLLGGARVVVGVDTGLSHLAVALGRPVIGIYCASNPRETGLYGRDRIVNLGNIANPPDVTTVIAALEKLLTP
jgi:heptosyltransferase I